MGDSTFTPVGGRGLWQHRRSTSSPTRKVRRVARGRVLDRFYYSSGQGSRRRRRYARARRLRGVGRRISPSTHTAGRGRRTSSSGYTSGSASAGAAPAIYSGDFDGDRGLRHRRARPATSQWLVLKSSSNYTASDRHTGTSADMPSGRDHTGVRPCRPRRRLRRYANDLTVYNPASGVWCFSRRAPASPARPTVRGAGAEQR